MTMKRIFLTILAVAALVLTASATDLTGKRIYVNPGHGSFGPNDRPMPTIPYPNLPSTGMPDTAGFYESNTNLWKCQYLGQKLAAAGATVVYSRTQNGPWPYEKVNGDYPTYTWTDYQNRPDYEQYNRSLSEICEEVEAGNFDLFISVHSNAASEGTTTNFPIFLYRGTDSKPSAFEQACYNFGAAAWPYRYSVMDAGIDPATNYSMSQVNLRGDVSFMGSGSTSTRSNGKSYYGYYGVLKHGTVGGLWEGYFHTYQPARHRALNPDYCHMEGLAYFRGIMDYFQADADTVGYILGTVKDMDKKMTHPLFKYAPKSNDQWIPCNGATVYLLNQSGDTLQNYTVDNNYNGVFVFYDLQPGTYHLAAECAGYEPLNAEQLAANVVVTANQTAHAMLYLRDTAWQPEAVTMETYPDKSSGVMGLDGAYNFGAAQTTNFASVVAGKLVRQVLVRDDNETYVLALDTAAGAHASHIYRINTLTGALIEEVSTAGTQGDIYPIYNIAFTADSVLVGCNYGENQYDDSQVASGNTKVRGTFRTYYWDMDSLQHAPTQWVTTQWSGNFYNANVGESFAVSGELASAYIYTDALTITGTKIRIAQISTEDMHFVSVVRNQDNAITTTAYGAQYGAIASPNSDEEMILAGALQSIEFAFAADAKSPIIHFNADALLGGGAFKYGGKSVVAAPIVANGVVQGVKLVNMTDGMAQVAVSTTNINLSDTTTYCSVKPLAQGKDIVIYIATDKAIYRYTTQGQTQPTFSNIYAYGHQMTKTAEGYTFNFKLNTVPTAAAVVILGNDSTEKARFAVTAPVAGQNTLSVAMADMPTDSMLRWAVEASAPLVGNWAQIASYKGSLTRAFNAVNVYPETDQFATIYLMDRAGAGSSNNGLYVMNPDLTLQNTTPYKGQQSVYSSPYRFGIASDGWVFVGDWGDDHSGVYVVDPADPAGTHTNFFAGSQNSSGVWSNNGVPEGSSTPSVFVYGTGADTKLLVYNEDPANGLPTNGLCVYNIGQPDGSILHSWNGAPSATIAFAGQLNTNGNVWGCSHGVWVSQHRGPGNNNSAATSLRFYTWAGECTYASYEAPVDAFEMPIIDGSYGSCFAISKDEKQVILRGVDSDFMVFDIAWEGDTPTLTLAYRVNTGNNDDFGLLQMNWDYAGNLITSGNEGVIVWAVPSETNTTLTPAPISQTINAVAVTGIALDTHSLDMMSGEKETLIATITPTNATIKKVVWSTSDANVATVSGGIVTAVGNGQAVIKATTQDGNFADSCVVTVTVAVKGIQLNVKTANIKGGETFQLVATFTPADATNQNVVWRSDDTMIATVDENGLVTGVGDGMATITATSQENPEISASAIITVDVVSDLNNTEASTCTKIFEDGQVYIIRDGVKITVTGVRVE